MKVVFSRKGFDSSSGGVPSPILDDRLISLPIPTGKYPSKTNYEDIGLGKLVGDLTKGKIESRHLCHHDPNLNMGALGQAGAAASHLCNQKVGTGDLFIFFGLYQRVGRSSNTYFYEPESKPEHWMFGWLSVGKTIKLGSDGRWALDEFPFLDGHPHCLSGWKKKKKKNTLYLASEKLSIGKRTIDIPGAGIFPAVNEKLRLSIPGQKTSVWKVPNWLNPSHGGVGMTYHPAAECWGKETVQTAGRGQEFVAEIAERQDALDWLESLFLDACQ